MDPLGRRRSDVSDEFVVDFASEDWSDSSQDTQPRPTRSEWFSPGERFSPERSLQFSQQELHCHFIEIGQCHEGQGVFPLTKVFGVIGEKASRSPHGGNSSREGPVVIRKHGPNLKTWLEKVSWILHLTVLDVLITVLGLRMEP
jgi:hypothetical protein